MTECSPPGRPFLHDQLRFLHDQLRLLHDRLAFSM
jgi:hypothetical protein